MILMQGKGVSKGVANGPIYFFQRPGATITDAPAADIEAEKARIAAVQEKAANQLNALAQKAREETGDETAVLFETHAMFVEDDDYVECMMAALNEKRCTAERAIEIADEEFSAMLAAMDDAYMQARAADIKDVTRRILNNLMGIAEGGIDSDTPADEHSQKEKIMRKNFGAKPYTYPQPVFVIATYGPDGTPDAMNAAWGGISDTTELSMYLSAGHKTTKNILERKAFTVSMADAAHVAEYDYVGVVSANDVLAPIVFDPVNSAYYKLGGKVGNAFADGLKLK